MFDIGWSEMAIIMMVALIVIGPKDLPRLARQIGKWTAKARGMAREFQRSLDDMAREAELQDIKAEMDKLSRTDMRQRIEETIDPEGDLRRRLARPFDDRRHDDPDEDEPGLDRSVEEDDEPEPARAAKSQPPPAPLPPPAAPPLAQAAKPVAAAPASQPAADDPRAPVRADEKR